MAYRIAAEGLAHAKRAGRTIGRQQRRLFATALLSAGCLIGGCTSTKSTSPSDSPFASKPQSSASKVASALNPVTIGKSVSNSVKSSSAKMSRAMASKKPETPVRKKSFWPFEKGPDAEFYVAVARVHEQENNVEGALAQYEKALEKDKNYAPALVGCAQLLDREGQKVKATEYYLRAVKAHPKDASIANNLGLCYARQGKLDDAIVYLNKAVELQPDRDLYRNNIATVLVEVGRVDEAVAHVSKVYGEPVAHYNIGIMLNQQGNTRAAEQQFALALRKDPGMDQARQWLDQLNAEGEPKAQMASAEIVEERAAPAGQAAPNPRLRLAARPTGAHAGNEATHAMPTGPGTPPSPEQARSANGDFDPASLPTPEQGVRPLPPVGGSYVPPSRY